MYSKQVEPKGGGVAPSLDMPAAVFFKPASVPDRIDSTFTQVFHSNICVMGSGQAGNVLL